MEDEITKFYKLNTYGKIVINDKEVWYGCIQDVSSKLGLAKLYVTEWFNREKPQKEFTEITVPITKFHIKYDQEMEQ